MSTFRLDVPRGSIQSAARSQARLHGTSGVHIAGGQAIINGCGSGLVELDVDPPLRTGRGMSTLFARQRVGSIVLSMTDPEAFITAVRRRGVNGGRTGR